MHSVIIACTITTLITTYIYIASFKVQLSQQLHCSVSYRWGYRNRPKAGKIGMVAGHRLETQLKNRVQSLKLLVSKSNFVIFLKKWHSHKKFGVGLGFQGSCALNLVLFSYGLA